MSEKVVKFEPREVGQGYRFDPDQILEDAKGSDFTNLVIIGELPDGETHVMAASNAGEALILIERAKRKLVFGE